MAGGNSYLEIDVLMNSSLQSDAGKAEAGLNAVDASGKRAGRTLDATSLVTRGTARELATLARAGTAVGGALMMGGLAAEKMGDDYKGAAEAAQILGGAILAISMAATVAGPVWKAGATILHGSLVAALKEAIIGSGAHVAALQAEAVATIEAAGAQEGLSVSIGSTGAALTIEAEQMGAVYASETLMSRGAIDAVAAEEALAAAGLTVSPSLVGMAAAEDEVIIATTGLSTAMRALVAATVIGALVTAAYLVWQYFQAGKDAAKEYDAALKDLDKDLSVIGAEQTVLNAALKDAESRYKQSSDSIKDLTDAQQKNKEVTEQQVRAQRTLRDALWGQKDANRELAEAVRSKDREAIERARENKIHADEAVSDARKEIDQLGEQKRQNDEIIAQNKDLATLLKEQLQAKEDQASIDSELAAINKAKEEAEAMKEVINWQKSGVELSSDQLQLLMRSDAYAKALMTVPGNLTRYPETGFVARQLMPGGGGFGAAAGLIQSGALEERVVLNPMFQQAGMTPADVQALQNVQIIVNSADEAATVAAGLGKDNRTYALKRAGYPA